MTNNDELALKLKAAADAWQNADEKYDRAEITISDFISAADQYNGIIKDPATILALLAERDADKNRIAEFQRQEHYRTRQAVIDGLAACGECWDDIKEYMERWDAEAERIKLKAEE